MNIQCDLLFAARIRMARALIGSGEVSRSMIDLGQRRDSCWKQPLCARGNVTEHTPGLPPVNKPNTGLELDQKTTRSLNITMSGPISLISNISNSCPRWCTEKSRSLSTERVLRRITSSTAQGAAFGVELSLTKERHEYGACHKPPELESSPILLTNEAYRRRRRRWNSRSATQHHGRAEEKRVQ